MARLCIRVAPNNHPTDARLDALRTHEGDVVCVEEDGHVFSYAEMNNGQYRIIDVPGVSRADFNSIVESVSDVNEVMIKRRKWCLPITTLRSVAWQDVTTATKVQIDAITVLRV